MADKLLDLSGIGTGFYGIRTSATRTSALVYRRLTVPRMTGDSWVPLIHFKGHQHLMLH